MKYLILISVIFLSVSCCLKTKNSVVCECSDIRDLIIRHDNPNASDFIYSEGAGCERNITCGYNIITYARMWWNQTEIVNDDRRLDWPPLGLLYSIKGAGSETIGKPVNIFSFFGIVCEDGEWYVTKYPFGVTYRSKNNLPQRVGENGEVDGLKSLIYVIACEPPAESA